MGKLIYAQEALNYKGQAIFLAGPTPRSVDVKGWRDKAIEELRRCGFEGTILIPEMRNKDYGDGFAYKEQIEWEHDAMEKSTVVLFWIPRRLPDMPAFTTNTEFGYWLAKAPGKIMLGIPDGAPKCDYIRYMANKEKIWCYCDLHTLALMTEYKLKETNREKDI